MYYGIAERRFCFSPSADETRHAHLGRPDAIVVTEVAALLADYHGLDVTRHGVVLSVGRVIRGLGQQGNHPARLQKEFGACATHHGGVVRLGQQPTLAHGRFGQSGMQPLRTRRSHHHTHGLLGLKLLLLRRRHRATQLHFFDRLNCDAVGQALLLLDGKRLLLMELLRLLWRVWRDSEARSCLTS